LHFSAADKASAYADNPAQRSVPSAFGPIGILPCTRRKRRAPRSSGELCGLALKSSANVSLMVAAVRCEASPLPLVADTSFGAKSRQETSLALLMLRQPCIRVRCAPA